jgi:hypothetical protein
VLGSIALRRGGTPRVRRLALVGALASVAYIVATALHHDWNPPRIRSSAVAISRCSPQSPATSAWFTVCSWSATASVPAWAWGPVSPARPRPSAPRSAPRRSPATPGLRRRARPAGPVRSPGGPARPRT